MPRRCWDLAGSPVSRGRTLWPVPGCLQRHGEGRVSGVQPADLPHRGPWWKAATHESCGLCQHRAGLLPGPAASSSAVPPKAEPCCVMGGSAGPARAPGHRAWAGTAPPALLIMRPPRGDRLRSAPEKSLLFSCLFSLFSRCLYSGELQELQLAEHTLLLPAACRWWPALSCVVLPRAAISRHPWCPQGHLPSGGPS